MKNFIPYSSLFLFLLLASYTNAQTVKFKVTFDSPKCYSKADFPTSSLAIDQFFADGLGYTTCVNDCPFPNYPSCVPQLVAGYAPEESSTEWCFVGTLLCEWICDVPPLPDTDVKLEEEEGEQDSDNSKDKNRESGHKNQSIDFTQTPTTDTKKNIVSTLSLFPNPNSGIFTLDIALNTPNVDVEVLICDWMGRRILQSTYPSESSTLLRTAIDISHSPDGIYFASIWVDGEMLKTSRFAIQK